MNSIGTILPLLLLALSTGLLRGEFRAGAAAQNITPALGIRINGGVGPGIAQQIHDDLFARALVLDNGTNRLVFVVVDSCLIDRPVFDSARKLIQQKCGIPERNVLLSSTHTHSGGAVCYVHLTDQDETYRQWLPGRIADGVQRAVNHLAPAQIGWGSAQVPQHVFCRRLLLKPGITYTNQLGQTGEAVKMNWDSPHPADLEMAGPVDPEVFFLYVKHRDGRPLALLANYSLHYVGDVGPGHISADYFGYFSDRMQELLKADRQDPPFVAMMSNGTSGDINNIDYRTQWKSPAPYTQIRRVAHDVAQEVYARVPSIQFQDQPRLEMAWRELPLAIRKPAPGTVEKAKQLIGQRGLNPLAGWTDDYAREAILLADFPNTVSVPLQVFRIGAVAVAAWPGEIFAVSGLDLKRRSPIQPLFNIGLANGWYGYIPPPEQHQLGGYETWLARSSCLELEATAKIAEIFVTLLSQLK